MLSSCVFAKTKSKKAVDVCVVIVGASCVAASEAVEDLAAQVAEGKASGVIHTIVDGQAWFVTKLDETEWLNGGENWRMLGSQICSSARQHGYESIQIDLDPAADSAEVAAQSLTEGCILGDYRYLACRSGKAAKRADLRIAIPGLTAAVKRGVDVAESQNLARFVADSPANICTPKGFVAIAKKELAGLPVKIETVRGVAALQKANFPGLVQVGMGSQEEPIMMRVTYDPKGALKTGAKKTKKTQKHLALVGKGICFDTGGISLKPGPGMWAMKGDMGGAAAMLGAIRLIALQKPNVPVSAYFALAENMPDGKAQKPGDIYKARNGKFIHVDNTDAEGRLVLSDVLTYACEQGATHVVDAATLTGACIIALGNSVAAVMSSDDGFAQDVRTAGQEVGEELWQLPLYGEYRKQLDHMHADINNIGGKGAGTITAGLFLKEFVSEDVQWAHCDIAGPALQTSGWRYYTKGMTGFGVRSFASLAKNIAQAK